MSFRYELAVLGSPVSHSLSPVMHEAGLEALGLTGSYVAIDVDEEGMRRCYQLVGEDESEPTLGRISWRSPIGRALLKRRVGDVVTVRRPAGDIELEVLSIDYM